MAGLGITDVESFAARFLNNIVYSQASEVAPWLDMLEVHDEPNRVGIVDIMIDEHDGIATMADGGLFPTGSSATPYQGKYDPILTAAIVNIGRVAARLVRNEADGLDLLSRLTKASTRGAWRQVARRHLSSNLGTVQSSVTANSSTTFEVSDSAASAFRVGQAFEIYNSATPVEGHTQATLLTVTNIARTTTGNATITFHGTGTSGSASQSWVIGYTVYLRGQASSGTLPLALGDVTADADLMGLSKSVAEWSGNLDSATTVLSIPALEDLYTTIQRRSDDEDCFLLCNPDNASRYRKLLQNNVRYASGDTLDPTGGTQKLGFMEMAVCIDKNVDSQDVFMVDKKSISLHQFLPFGADQNEGQTVDGDSGLAATLVSQTNASFLIQLLGVHNLRIQKRCSSGRMSALVA